MTPYYMRYETHCLIRYMVEEGWVIVNVGFMWPNLLVVMALDVMIVVRLKVLNISILWSVIHVVLRIQGIEDLDKIIHVLSVNPISLMRDTY